MRMPNQLPTLPLAKIELAKGKTMRAPPQSMFNMKQRSLNEAALKLATSKGLKVERIGGIYWRITYWGDNGTSNTTNVVSDIEMREFVKTY